MRVNVYQEDITGEVVITSKLVMKGGLYVPYTGVRLNLRGDDAVTFWFQEGQEAALHNLFEIVGDITQ